MDLLAHALAERAVDELVLLHPRLAAERRAHDHRLEVMAVAGHLDVLALEACLDPLLDLFGIHRLVEFVSTAQSASVIGDPLDRSRSQPGRSASPSSSVTP